ncbi:MAG: carboxypeptidase regulatory-like domain-containing protein [Fibrobacteria bacterium]|nr:carboxypeptidase regulatory-like domain-containing protein [Fibrobacteria bacterium]
MTQLPLGLYRQKDSIKVGYTGGSGDVQLKSSSIPGGGVDIEHYNLVHIPPWPASGTKVFIYANEVESEYLETDLKIGINYCILISGSKKSAEFQIVMESSKAPDLVSPVNETKLSDLTPEFKWTGNAPYYTVLISDQPFFIKDEKLQNLNAIWQATTRNKSIRYGEKSDFGSSVKPPPLMSGKTYNWLVLNNYDPSANIISTVISTPMSFTYEADVPPKPVLSIPPNNDTLTSNAPLVFRWSAVNGAVNYRIDLFEENVISDNEATSPILQKYVNNPEAVLDDPNGLLRELPYSWRVYAYDAKGRANASESFSFYNSVDANSIVIRVFDNNEKPVPYAKISFDRVPGLRHPFIAEGPTDEQGFIRFEHMPFRNYSIKAEKDGFEPKTIQFELKGSFDQKMILSPTLGKVYGTVIAQGSGSAITNALVSISSVNEPDMDPKHQLSSYTGDFNFEVPFGSWRVSVKHQEYATPEPGIATVSNDNKVGKIDFAMKSLTYRVSGNVSNSYTGDNIYDVSVTAKQDGSNRFFQTLGDGSFSFNAQSGQIELVFEKAGFSSKTMFLEIISDIKKSLSLEPGASTVSGTVEDTDGKYQPDVIVKAISDSREILQPTDRNGAYLMSLPAGNWVLTAIKKGYSSLSKHNVLLEYGQDIYADFLVKKNASFINGQVSEKTATGIQKLSNVTVRVVETGDYVVTDALGKYKLSVEKGTNTLTAFLAGYSFSETPQLNIGSNDTLYNINFTGVGNAARIGGIVYTKNGPAPSITVYARELTTGKVTSILSDNQGRFNISLFSGEYTVFGKKDGYLSDTLTNLRLNPGVQYSGKDIRLTKNTGIISGALYALGSPLLNKNCQVIYTSIDGVNTAPVSSAGEFQFEIGANKAYSVKAECVDYIPSSETVYTLSADETQFARITLYPSDISYSCTVYSSKTGSGLSDVSLTITDKNSGESQSLISDSKGLYRFNLVAGNYLLAMQKVGYLNKEKNITLNVGTSISGAKDTLLIDEGGISGLVLNNASQPVVGTNIILSRIGVSVPMIKTDAQGRFRLDGLAAGFYSLTTSAHNYYEAKQNVFISANLISKADLELIPWTGKISGNCRLSNGDVLGNVQIFVQSGALSRSAFSASDGIFSFDSLPAGEYMIKVYLDKHAVDQIYSGKSLIEGGILSGINFELTPFSGEVTLIPEGVVNVSHLRFNLVNENTRDEYPSLEASPFEFALPLGNYELTITNSGYAITSSSVLTVSGKHSFRVNVEQQKGTVNGIVKNQDGVTVKALSMKLIPFSGSFEEIQTATNTNGGFTISDLPVGVQYRIGCISPRYKCVEQNITIIKSTSLNILAEDFSSSISGEITLDGEKSADARIQISGAGNPSRSGYPGTDGSYRINNLRAEKGSLLKVTVAVAGVVPVSKEIELKAGESTTGFNFALKRSRVSYSDILLTNSRKLDNSKVLIINSNTKDTVTTSGSGTFGLDDLLPGTVLTVKTLLDPVGFDNVTKTITITGVEDESFTTLINEHNSMVTINTNVADFSIYINGEFYENAKGQSFVLKGLAAANYKISVAKNNYFSETVSRSVYLDGTFSAQETIEFELKELSAGVYGKVYESRNQKNNQGRNNIKLVLQDTNTKVEDTVLTRDDATYFFSVDVPKEYLLKVTLPGYKDYAEYVTIGNEAFEKNITLTAYTQSVSGRVVSDSTVDFTSTTVSLLNTSGSREQTSCNASGDFAFLNLESQTAYTIKALTEKLSSFDTTFVLPLNQTVSTLLKLIKLADVSGSAMSDGQHIPGVSISIINKIDGNITQAITDSLGRFVVSGLRNGVYLVQAEKEGFINLTGDVHIKITNNQVEGVADFNLSPKETGLFGIVLDEAGTGVEVDMVFIKGDDFLTLKSDVAGQYLLKGIEAGTYVIHINHLAFTQFTDTLVFSGEEFQEVNFKLSRIRNRLSGIVVSAINEKLNIVNAKLFITTESGLVDTVESDSNGVYIADFSTTPGAFVNVDSITAAGYESLSNQKVILDTYGSGTQVLRLVPVFSFDGKIRLTVVEKGKPVENIEMRLVSDFSEDEVVSKKDNPVLFSGLRIPNNYSVSIQRDGYDDLKAFFQLSAAIPEVSDSLFYPSSQFKAKITSDGTAPIAAEVYVGELKMFADTAIAGLYQSPADMQKGNYEIAVSVLEKTRLPLLPYTISLNTDEIRIDQIPFPWRIVQLQDTIMGEPFSGLLEIEKSVSVDKIKNNIVAKWYYKYSDASVYDSLSMDVISSQGIYTYSATMPAFLKPGEVQYYYRVTQKDAIISSNNSSELAVYTNANAPRSFKVFDPNVLKAISFAPASLEADSVLMAKEGRMIANVNLFGDNGRDLNVYFDRNVEKNEDISITWSFESEKVTLESNGSTLQQSSKNPRTVTLLAGGPGNFHVYCTVKVDKNTVQKEISVVVKDIEAEKIALRFEDENMLLTEGSVIELRNRTSKGYQFSAVGYTKDDVSFIISPEWSLTDSAVLDTAFNDEFSQGIFYPNNEVAGADTLIIRDPVSELSFRVPLKTYLQVEPGDSSTVTVQNGKGAGLAIPLDGLESAVRIDFTQPEVSDILVVSPSTELAGDIINIELTPPQPFKRSRGAYVSLPVKASARNGEIFVGHWNSKRLQWDKLETEGNMTSDSVITALATTFSPFAVQMESRPLGAYQLKVMPNPFTPNDPWALQLQYEVSSRKASLIGVQIEVYNMRGDLVFKSNKNVIAKSDSVVAGTRKQEEGASRETRLGDQSLYLWDGKTTDGKLCRNGRYVLKLTVSDSEDVKTYLKQVVLLK